MAGVLVFNRNLRYGGGHVFVGNTLPVNSGNDFDRQGLH